MPDRTSVSTHYARDGLLAAIEAGVRRLGKTPGTVGVADLGPVDEFHIGGRIATEAFLDQLALEPDERVLDIGCGLGGAGRFAAERYGVKVTGIDLTPAFIEAGRALTGWVGLDGRVALERGDATATGYPDGSFDAVYMLHVGMNISDKAALAAEIARLLRPGGRAGVYDVMRTGDGAVIFPVPWASGPEESALAPAAHYKAAFSEAGLGLRAERDRRAFALDFFAELKRRTEAAGGPPPLGLHLVMGEAAPAKIANLVATIAAGTVAPVELIFEKDA